MLFRVADGYYYLLCPFFGGQLARTGATPQHGAHYHCCRIELFMKNDGLVLRRVLLVEPCRNSIKNRFIS